MIRVNLISVTPGQTPAREWFPKEQRSAAVGLVLLLSTAIGVTSWWWYLRHERTRVEQSITMAEADLARLKDVAQLVERATARKGELADRLDLIERLRATMRAPMHLLETVSRSVPHGLWLLEIKQIGTTVQLDGRAMTLTPVSDFARDMQSSGFFQMPVEIVSVTSETVEEQPVLRFLMKADVATPGIAAAKAAPVANDAPAPPPPPMPAITPAPTPAPAAAPVALAGPPRTEVAPARASGGR